MCIYVREITNEEGNKLKRILRYSKDTIEVKRAQIVLASAQGMTVPEICKVFGYHRNYVSRVIHNFNKDGFKSLKSKYENCGRKPVISEEIKQKIADVALCRPSDLGLPFTQWSLPKLRDYVMEKGIVESISVEWIRQILKERGIKYRRTKTWKESNDPDYDFKKTE